MTSAYTAPKAAAAAGISFERLTSSMVCAALLRRAENPENCAGTGCEKESDQKVNPLLLACNRWLLRFILLLNAALLVANGIQFMQVEGNGWPLFVSAALLLSVEPVVLWLRSLEK